MIKERENLCVGKMLKINDSRAVNQIKPSLSSGTSAWLWKGTKPNECLSQYRRISGKRLLALPIGSNSKVHCLLQRLGKESKHQKQFICSKKAQFGDEALANMIATYFKLVGNVTQMYTTNDKVILLHQQYKWKEWNVKKTMTGWRCCGICLLMVV